MTGPTNPTASAACLALSQRQVGDASGWSAAQWADQLAEDALTRGDPPLAHYRPYRTALAYLLRPGQVTARTEGDVSEQYASSAATIERLRELDVEWTAARIPAEPGTTGEWDGAITWGGW